MTKDSDFGSGFDLASDSEDDNDDFMKVTRRDVFDINTVAQVMWLILAVVTAVFQECPNPANNSKTLTKKQHALRALKKGAVQNKKIVFEDDGQTEAVSSKHEFPTSNI